jgi:hypothetical protein
VLKLIEERWGLRHLTARDHWHMSTPQVPDTRKLFYGAGNVDRVDQLWRRRRPRGQTLRFTLGSRRGFLGNGLSLLDHVREKCRALDHGRDSSMVHRIPPSWRPQSEDLGELLLDGTLSSLCLQRPR